MLPKSTLLNPCGILPKYVFTDSFTLSELDVNDNEISEKMITIDESSISSEFDREHKFVKSANADEF